MSCRLFLRDRPDSQPLSRFLFEVKTCWRKWLYRRNRLRLLTWEVFYRLLQRYPLAPVRTSRSIYTAQRAHDSRHRMPKCGHVRVCESPGSATAQGTRSGAGNEYRDSTSCAPPNARCELAFPASVVNTSAGYQSVWMRQSRSPRSSWLLAFVAQDGSSCVTNGNRGQG